ncbi:amino acid/amide ABC transporter ATP-binding protein 2, HAAT family [Pyrobaculum islandicum DSM 4184]|uniref:Amino acid/amide ABC transporter ATP-binding protein 2, HAAT family n=1 Tax=Pyrobaculum islandicum (strain DSM 4184 / JCM 9189 / GEO3) TaxID=384616 RepID=A1RRU9_PYRIL|nr:ABC transporter ATP-binding protein [Pyrobaculum islandicum]ABL87681.1 amino acid/amide ABC transporter ATP-binding protein 2, HAAT family [Pyrobaculum islandicum DSM 4184]
MAEVLRVEKLEAGYGKFHVLFGVDIVVNSGEIVVLLGPNGAGKSTLLNSIVGMADVYSGRITLLGHDVTGKPPHEVMKLGVAYVMQSPNNFGTPNIFGELTVFENLIAASAGLSKKDVLKRVEEIYEIFPRLRELRDRKAKFLSGGERQMLAISLGLMKNPKLLMLDEPTAGLAPKLVSEFFSVIKDIRDKFGISILLVEQNAKKALEIGDRAYVLVTGRIRYSGDTKSIDEDRLAKLFLGQ